MDAAAIEIRPPESLSAPPLVPNRADMISHLQVIYPRPEMDPIYITTMLEQQSGEPHIQTRKFSDYESVADFAVRENKRGANIYYTPNPLRDQNFSGQKPSKPDIFGLRHIIADIDPEKYTPDAALSDDQNASRAEAHYSAERELISQVIADLDIEPTWKVFTGGGYQIGYRLKYAEPIVERGKTADPKSPQWKAAVARLEDYNRTFEIKLGGDAVHNIERLLRLAGTIHTRYTDTHFNRETKRKTDGRHRTHQRCKSLSGNATERKVGTAKAVHAQAHPALAGGAPPNWDVTRWTRRRVLVLTLPECFLSDNDRMVAKCHIRPLAISGSGRLQAQAP